MADETGAAGERRVWWKLKRSRRYVADWCANAGTPAPIEAGPFPVRAQTVADLAAARWGLLAWEDPEQTERPAAPFWSGVRAFDGVAEPAEDASETLAEVARQGGAVVSGLRLLDGSVILRLSRARREEQIRIADGASFDAAESSFHMWMAVINPGTREKLAELESLWAIVHPPRRRTVR